MTIAEEVKRIIETLNPSDLCDYIEEQQITINRQEVKIARLEEEKESYRKSWVTALDSIKRQDAEIEKLQKYINGHKARIDAIKEFIERFVKKAEIVSGGDYGFTYEITSDELDSIAEEMEREQGEQ